MPWNLPSVKMLQQTNNSFPRVDDISDEFVCKRATLAEDGNSYFCGSVDKLSGLPSGLGVFVAHEWIHCGEFDSKRVI